MVLLEGKWCNDYAINKQRCSPKKYNIGIENENNDFRTTDREKQVVLTLLGIGILSLVIATFFDRNVTQAVMNQNSIFGNIFQNYADQGAQVVTFVSAEVIAWYIWRRLNEHLIKYIMTGGMLLLALNQLLALLQDALSYTFSMLNNIAPVSYTHLTLPTKA